MVGGGTTESFVSPQTVFTVAATTTAIRVQVASTPEPWSLEFTPPDGRSLRNGIYEGAQLAGLNASGVPGIDVNASAVGCNPVTGRFELSDVQTDGHGAILGFALQFEQHCDGRQPALFGQMLFNSTATVAPIVSVAGTQVLKGNAGTSDGLVTLSVSQPLQAAATVHYATVNDTAVAGTDYVTKGGNLKFPAGVTSEVVAIPIIGNTLATGDRAFSVRLRSPVGVAPGFTEASVAIADPNSPQTVIALTSQVGDLIGRGVDWLETSSYARTEAAFKNNRAFVTVKSPEFWFMKFAAPLGKPLVPGSYDRAGIVATKDSPGLDVSGNHSGCSSTSGNFTVNAIATKPQILSVDFQQHCNYMPPSLFGSIRINALLQQISITNATVTGTDANFLVTVSPPSTVAVSAFFSTVDGTAKGGRDYRYIAKAVTIRAGQVSTMVSVPLLPKAKHGRVFYGTIVSADTPPVWINSGSAKL
jgi:hypothetical protein